MISALLTSALQICVLWWIAADHAPERQMAILSVALAHPEWVASMAGSVLKDLCVSTSTPLVGLRNTRSGPGLGLFDPLRNKASLMSEQNDIQKQSAIEALLHALPIGVEIYDRDFNALFFNSAADELFLYPEKPIIHHDEWWEFGFPDLRERTRVIAEWYRMVDAARADPSQVQMGEWNVRCRDGAQHFVQFRFRYIDDTFLLVLLDVTERRQLEAELRRLATTDPLTQLFNRRHFMDVAQNTFAQARRTHAPLSLLMLDIDHFKTVNDTHGHGVGDAVIREVASRCQNALRPDDLIARMGGEEFAVLMPATPLPDAHRQAERLLEAIVSRPLVAANVTLPVSVSIGGAQCLPDDLTLDATLTRADRALYAAKRSGRGRAVFDASEAGADG